MSFFFIIYRHLANIIFAPPRKSGRSSKIMAIVRRQGLRPRICAQCKLWQMVEQRGNGRYSSRCLLHFFRCESPEKGTPLHEKGWWRIFAIVNRASLSNYLNPWVDEATQARETKFPWCTTFVHRCLGLSASDSPWDLPYQIWLLLANGKEWAFYLFAVWCRHASTSVVDIILHACFTNR